MYKNSVTLLFGAQSLECYLLWARWRNKSEFFNSPIWCLVSRVRVSATQGPLFQEQEEDRLIFLRTFLSLPLTLMTLGWLSVQMVRLKCLGTFLGVVRMGVSGGEGHHTSTRSCLTLIWAFPGGSVCKEPACQWRSCRRPRFNPWVRKIPWRRAWQPTPVFLPGESHGQRSLAGYSLWGCRVSDTTDSTEHIHTRFSSHSTPSIFRGRKGLREEKWLHPNHRASSSQADRPGGQPTYWKAGRCGWGCLRRQWQSRACRFLVRECRALSGEQSAVPPSVPGHHARHVPALIWSPSHYSMLRTVCSLSCVLGISSAFPSPTIDETICRVVI